MMEPFFSFRGISSARSIHRGQGPNLIRFILAAFCLLVVTGCPPEKPVLKLGGGPNGGTFENIARRLAFILNEDLSGVQVKDLPTGGSLANLQKVNQGEFDMGLVFGGDAYLGRQGTLGEGIPEQKNVLALTRLYGATAHLVVPASSFVNSLSDLKKRRVAIGGTGTGSAQTAQRFFTHLGLWDKIIPIHEGYATAIEDMKQGNIDAVWLQVGYPSKYLLQVSAEMPLRYLNLYEAAITSGFFSLFPFYTAVRIPGGSYQGQAAEVATFQDAALWVANSSVKNETVFEALTALFSERGLARMHVLAVAWDTELNKGLHGVRIPLHPGAIQFWKANGIPLPGGL